MAAKSRQSARLPDSALPRPLWDRLPVITFWLLPSAIGAPIIARAIIHAGGRNARLPATPDK
jgi:hypothetical protein